MFYEILSAAGLIVFIICFGIVLKDIPAEEQRKKRFWFLFGLIFLVLALFTLNFEGKISVRKKLANEVDLQQVPVMGQRDFSAQIKMTYKNGELDSVTLVPKTTTAIEVDHAAETGK
jgi:hypothetical protein